MFMAMLVPIEVTEKCHAVTAGLFIGFHVMVLYCYTAPKKKTRYDDGVDSPQKKVAPLGIAWWQKIKKSKNRKKKIPQNAAR